MTIRAAARPTPYLAASIWSDIYHWCCSSGDGGETMVLLGLVVVLLAVLRRRRALRALYGPPPGPLQRQLSRPLPPGVHFLPSFSAPKHHQVQSELQTALHVADCVMLRAAPRSPTHVKFPTPPLPPCAPARPPLLPSLPLKKNAALLLGSEQVCTAEWRPVIVTIDQWPTYKCHCPQRQQQRQASRAAAHAARRSPAQIQGRGRPVRMMVAVHQRLEPQPARVKLSRRARPAAPHKAARQRAHGRSLQHWRPPPRPHVAGATEMLQGAPLPAPALSGGHTPASARLRRRILLYTWAMPLILGGQTGNEPTVLVCPTTGAETPDLLRTSIDC